MRSFGIRQRVLILALVPTITISILLTAFFTSTRLYDLEETFRERGEAIALKLASHTDYGIYTRNAEVLKNVATKALEEYGLQGIRFLTETGETITSVGKSRFSGLDLPSFSGENPSHSVYTKEASPLLTFVVPILLFQEKEDGASIVEQKETLVGWVQIELDSTPVKIREYEVLFHTGVIVLLGLGLSGLHAFQMGRKVTRPILELAQAVEQIRKGDLNTRIRTSAYPELQILESGFNTMAQALEDAHAELQNKVDRATSSLRKTLETIEVQNLELEIARRTAEKANQVKSEFLADMSHEIRTPLNSVIGFLDILKKTVLNPKQQHYLSIMDKSAGTLLSIINNILDFTKIEAGKLSIDRSVTDLRSCVEEIVALFKPEAESKNINLRVSLANSISNQYLSDPLRIKQILSNFIKNAIKFTDQGSILIEVALEKESTKFALLKFSVKDSGIGLSKEEKNQLFHPFSQVKIGNPRQSGGTGLGLVICKKLVEHLNGSIGVESELEKGSTFWFTVQVEKILEALPTKQAASLMPLSKMPIALNPYSVLVVDDNPDNLELIETLLLDLNIQVTRASSGPEAIEKFKSQSTAQPFDLIFMDIRMPQMNGIEATRALRSIEQETHQPPTRIIALTAHAMFNEKEALLAAEFDGVLLKPISVADLNALIFKWSPKKQIQTQTYSSVDTKNPIDWDLAKQLAGGKMDLALELFARLKNDLPEIKNQIEEAFESKEYERMKEWVHKLHGGTCYCGVPQLKQAVCSLEHVIDTRVNETILFHLKKVSKAIDTVLDTDAEFIS